MASTEKESIRPMGTRNLFFKHRQSATRPYRNTTSIRHLSRNMSQSHLNIFVVATIISSSIVKHPTHTSQPQRPG